MKNLLFALMGTSLLLVILTGCGQTDHTKSASDAPAQEAMDDNENVIKLNSEITELEEGFSAVRFEGDDGFKDFLLQGGASSDEEVAGFLMEHLLAGADLGLAGGEFGCSTLAVLSPDGEALFGRNFDWDNCEAMVVLSEPEDGYASVSTVNMDFITQGIGGGAAGLALKLDTVRTAAALYAPLDGMNEAGLAVSVNMIQDHASIEQDTGKPDITTTTAIRLLLNQAADVEEALELLGQYDLHGSMGMMVHFALADRTGRSVAVEYIDQERVVTETPAVTNFYLAEGEKNGIGTAQSHERYDILMKALSEQKTMDMREVQRVLDSVSKDNFDEFESTEWSVVFNLDTGIVHYYHRENYENRYTFSLRQEENR